MKLNPIDVSDMSAILGRYYPIYRIRTPIYQTAMINAIRANWAGPHRRLLDFGGGTGVIAEAISLLFPVEEVYSIDIMDRFVSGLKIHTKIYNGKKIPYSNRYFDACIINNVIHHIPVSIRKNMFCEIKRVTKGPIYIKDHITNRPIDNLRLTILDIVGNAAFGGATRAWYLSQADWIRLATVSGYTISREQSGSYRTRFAETLFPNYLETSMRWDP